MPHKAKKNGSSAYDLAKIKVIGVGGGGSHIISRMIGHFPRSVEFIAINTDHQDLNHCQARTKVYIGRSLTGGLGTGMNPDVGRQAAEENRSDISEALKGADLVFIAAGLGGGTGTGAGPIVAEVAKQSGALTLGFVTRPFAFEGSQRDRIAQEGIVKLREKVDALVIIPNDRIFSVISKETPIIKAFEAIDDVLRNALKGIVELIMNPGIINVDFADVRTIVADAGSAIVGMGIASGQDRVVKAVGQALNSPLLDVNPEGARGILLGVSGRDLKMNEVNEAAHIVAKTADPSARIIFGAYYDRKLRAKHLKITLIATGFSETAQPNSLFGTYFGEGRKDLGHGAKEGSAAPETALSEKEGAAVPKAKEKKKDKESDIWDIPTFLRRRKK
ncbi:MAG: cell division protein FtsZ [Candidatus Liptonbacteria bacterium]|nr:cell division protein FtsZ [Candidatus Liptonbacteria bacterium]